ncbi:MAG: PQQ-like beta-propeller repeat protein, partial [Actinobacteria bacterium]|nr:PQQ-like beta-propeller repeat protein [Actinomycetota bacterium]
MKRLLLALGMLGLLVVGAGAAYLLLERREAGDIRGSSTVEFVTTAESKPRPVAKPDGIVWPMYGFDVRRTRVGPGTLRPPFRAVWRFGARSLLEFPPAIAFGRLYFTNNSGTMFAVGAKKGGRAWRYVSGRCVASSPAVAGRLVIQSFLNRPPCNSERRNLDGQVVAFYAGSGRIRWRVKVGPVESSPLVAGGRVFFGDWHGRVYALRANRGRLLWVFPTDGKVKGGLAYADGRLFVGSYDHRVYAIRARDGKEIWRAESQDRLRGKGNFYSTPAVAYGRVYIGSTDGKVYSFGATSGKLRWSHGTGGYVYASPAVWRRTVYVGSYDRHLYALDAATGEQRWRFRANGPISGSATVLNGV